MADDATQELQRIRHAQQCRVGMGATADLRDAALAARYQLLEAGWGAEHPACQAMDDTATHYQRAWEGFRRQWLKATDAPSPAAAGSPEEEAQQ